MIRTLGDLPDCLSVDSRSLGARKMFLLGRLPGFEKSGYCNARADLLRHNASSDGERVERRFSIAGK